MRGIQNIFLALISLFPLLAHCPKDPQALGLEGLHAALDDLLSSSEDDDSDAGSIPSLEDDDINDEALSLLLKDLASSAPISDDDEPACGAGGGHRSVHRHPRTSHRAYTPSPARISNLAREITQYHIQKHFSLKNPRREAIEKSLSERTHGYHVEISTALTIIEGFVSSPTAAAVATKTRWRQLLNQTRYEPGTPLPLPLLKDFLELRLAHRILFLSLEDKALRHLLSTINGPLHHERIKNGVSAMESISSFLWTEKLPNIVNQADFPDDDSPHTAFEILYRHSRADSDQNEIYEQWGPISRFKSFFAMPLAEEFFGESQLLAAPERHFKARRISGSPVAARLASGDADDGDTRTTPGHSDTQSSLPFSAIKPPRIPPSSFNFIVKTIIESANGIGRPLEHTKPLDQEDPLYRNQISAALKFALIFLRSESAKIKALKAEFARLNREAIVRHDESIDQAEKLFANVRLSYHILLLCKACTRGYDEIPRILLNCSEHPSADQIQKALSLAEETSWSLIDENSKLERFYEPRKNAKLYCRIASLAAQPETTVFSGSALWGDIQINCGCESFSEDALDFCYTIQNTFLPAEYQTDLPCPTNDEFLTYASIIARDFLAWSSEAHYYLETRPLKLPGDGTPWLVPPEENAGETTRRLALLTLAHNMIYVLTYGTPDSSGHALLSTLRGDEPLCKRVCINGLYKNIPIDITVVSDTALTAIKNNKSALDRALALEGIQTINLAEKMPGAYRFFEQAYQQLSLPKVSPSAAEAAANCSKALFLPTPPPVAFASGHPSREVTHAPKTLAQQACGDERCHCDSDDEGDSVCHCDSDDD